MDVYVQKSYHVHMSQPSLTDVRKNLFRVVDEMLATDKPYRVTRGGKTIELSARLVDDAATLTPQERWQRFLKRPKRHSDKPSDFEALENAGHWEWRDDGEPR